MFSPGALNPFRPIEAPRFDSLRGHPSAVQPTTGITHGWDVITELPTVPLFPAAATVTVPLWAAKSRASFSRRSPFGDDRMIAELRLMTRAPARTLSMTASASCSGVALGFRWSATGFCEDGRSSRYTRTNCRSHEPRRPREHRPQASQAAPAPPRLGRTRFLRAGSFANPASPSPDGQGDRPVNQRDRDLRAAFTALHQIGQANQAQASHGAPPRRPGSYGEVIQMSAWLPVKQVYAETSRVAPILLCIVNIGTR